MASHDDDFQQEPAPQAKKSSGSKVLLILGIIGGLCLVVCCGGVGLLYYKFKDAISYTTDAAEIKKQTQEVVTLDVPDGYSPMTSMRISIGIVTMKMIIYQEGSGNQGGLVIMEMDQVGTDPKQMREQMLQQLRTQQAQGGAGGFNTQIVAQSTETKMFKINGEDVEFDFVKGNRPGENIVFRQVTGIFRGNNGTVMLILIVPDSEYNEEAVIKMIKSIRVPGSDTATESAEATTGEGTPKMDDGTNATADEDEGSPESETAPEKSE
jgi:hypothetical protein